MCGIAGFYGFRDDALIRRMSAQMYHRGPDGDGYHLSDEVTLLSRRLAIIDRKGGDQPIYNEDKSVAVVYNGEIYNYQVLRKSLESAGHTFRTHSDTEVIVHGYEEWGDDAFDRYNGMFGAAIYDLRRNRVVLARDHFGIKPLHFARIPSSNAKLQLIFSSELKPILYSGKIPVKVNEKVLYRYLVHRVHDDGEATFFEGIERLLPGEMLIIENDTAVRKKYTHLQEELLHKPAWANGLKDKEIVHCFHELLSQSVQDRLVSEVPVGTCLSGGLDSSSVVTLVHELLVKNTSTAQSVGNIQNTFSAVFPGSANDEEKYIDEVCQKNAPIASHKVKPQPEDFISDLQEFVRTQEEPTISTGPYAQYQVMREAHQHVTVVLDGQGADEMMAGYIPYYFVYLRQLWKQKKIIPLISECWHGKDIIFRFLMRNALYNRLSLKAKPQFLKKDFADQFHHETINVIQDNLKSRLQADMFSNSLQSLLRYEDRNSMRFSIEGRVPFLDLSLIRYVFSLPQRWIIRNGLNKYVLRESMRGLLPEMIRSRRNKIGFTTPEDEWMQKMKKEIYEILLSESLASRPYFDQPAVLKMFRMFLEGNTQDTLLIWRIVNTELWLREFIDPHIQKDVKKTHKLELGQSNHGKQITINVDGENYSRIPLRTEAVQKGDDLNVMISHVVHESIKKLPHRFVISDKTWYVVVSEKIVAISQGRSYFIWDIKAGWWAKVLSKCVTRTPAGIGLGSPWTMQIAIEEAGLGRIVSAAIISLLTRPFGLKGMFYRVAGHGIGAIDGPTEYSLFPSNVSAKLPPENPVKVAKELTHVIHESLKHTQEGMHFGGVVIIDANDIGRNVLGNATSMSDDFFENVMRDNPLSQASEQTPLAIVV